MRHFLVTALLFTVAASLAAAAQVPAQQADELYARARQVPPSTWVPPPSVDGQAPASLNGTGRNLWIKGADDFCLLMPPDPVHTDIVGALDTAVSYCLHPTNGTRPMPDGFLKTAHYRRSAKWTQISGTYEPGVMHLSPTDCGSEYDSFAPQGVTLQDGKFFFTFLGGCDQSGQSTYCMRICESYKYCSSEYDQLGCRYVAPGDYETPDAFTGCEADAGDPVMVYDGTSTFHQGQHPTPPPLAPPHSSQCTTIASPTPSGVTYPWNQFALTAKTSPTSAKPAPTSSADSTSTQPAAATQQPQDNSSIIPTRANASQHSGAVPSREATRLGWVAATLLAVGAAASMLA